jgi:hypothetical protein
MSLCIIKADPVFDYPFGLEAILQFSQMTASCLSDRHNRSMKMLSIARKCIVDA